MNVYEFFSQLDLRAVIVIIAAAGIAVAVFFSFSYFNTPKQIPKISSTQFYDSTTKSVVLVNNTISLSGAINCDIYVSGPSKEIKYYKTLNCNDLSSTEISENVLLGLFNNQKGTYTIIVQSKFQGQIMQFTIQ